MLSKTIAALVAVAALGVAGCEATFTPAEPVVTFYAGGTLAPVVDVPSDIWAYPHVYYGGTYVYLVGGIWYVPTPRGWMIYRTEPVELSRERTRIYRAQPYNPRNRYNRNPTYGYPRRDSNEPRPPTEINRERVYPAQPY